MELFVVATFCFGSLVCTTWSIPNIRHFNTGGVVVSAADEATEFTCLEGGIACWDGVVEGWGGVERGYIVEARHDVCVED